MSDFGWPSPIASYYRMQRRTPKVVDKRKKRLRVTDKHVRMISIIIVTIPTIVCDHHHYHNRRRIASSVYDCLILFSFIVTLFASYEEIDGATSASTVAFFSFLVKSLRLLLLLRLSPLLLLLLLLFLDRFILGLSKVRLFHFAAFLPLFNH